MLDGPRAGGDRVTGSNRALPSLPLLLWNTPPALRTILEQEGVAFQVIKELHPLALRAGRFVLFDGPRARAELKPFWKAENVAIDVQSLREGEAGDPFEQVLSTEARPSSWVLQGYRVSERVARHDRARIRRRVVARLRDLVTGNGGVWARLACFPDPYRSAFNLRVDLDECAPDDYFRFARARDPLEDATTHFVSTAAYGDDDDVLADLRPLDTHSHGHHHLVYREREANRVNLRRSLDALAAAGIEGRGFASPHGRWNVGLNDELEELGCPFSSEFQVGYDDLPFFPWVGNRRSTVLQVPVHPICEGLFFDAGATDARAVMSHLVAVVRTKIAAREPAFVYGHPERRLGRFPEVVAALAAVVADQPLTWRVGLGAFVEWWRWRLSRNWSLRVHAEGGFELGFDEWDARYPLAVEVLKGRHVARFPVVEQEMRMDQDRLVYEVRANEYALPPAMPVRRDLSLRSVVRDALDWETVTPIDDLATTSVRTLLKRELRVWRERSRRAV
jgi:hypothetical protein